MTLLSSLSDDEVGAFKARSALAIFAPPICRRRRRNDISETAWPSEHRRFVGSDEDGGFLANIAASGASNRTQRALASGAIKFDDLRAGLVSIGSHYRGVVRWVDWYGDGSLWVLNVALACCTLEFDAASSFAAELLQVPDDRARVAVVISGTVTDRLAPAVVAIVDGCERQTGRRPTVISFGACASSGGPYWDSYAVTKGVDQLVAVDAYVPGCPPPPEALSAVLDEVAGRVKA